MMTSRAVEGAPRRWLRMEGVALLVLAAVAFEALDGAWRWFAILFFAPDLSFLAYLAGPAIGAAGYNAVHSLVGPWVAASVAVAAGRIDLLPFVTIWAGHIGFDRMLGYGLKYPSAFGDTHLGRIGRGASSTEGRS